MASESKSDSLTPLQHATQQKGEITWSEFKRWFYQSDSEAEADSGEGPKLTGDADVDVRCCTLSR